MKCAVCKRPFRRGVEQAKRVEYWLQPDGTTKVFGFQMPDGPLAAATGQLVRVIHSLHYWQEHKDEARGGAHAGGVIQAYAGEGLDRDLRDTAEPGA